MNLRFASCQRNYVLGFLREGYPNTEITAERLPKLMAGIEKDIVRITDPKYHTLGLVVGQNYKDSDKSEVDEIANELRTL